jgi:uncharacterized protein YbaP (TraB family)
MNKFKLFFWVLVFQIFILKPIFAQDIDGLFWRAEKNGHIIFLFGTTHERLLNQEAVPRHVWIALANSEIVFTEFDNNEKIEKRDLISPLKDVKRDYRKNGYPINITVKNRLQKLVDDKLMSQEYMNLVLNRAPLDIFNDFPIIKSNPINEENFLSEKYIRADKGPDVDILNVALAQGKKLYALDYPIANLRFWAINCETEERNSQLIDSLIDSFVDDNYRHFNLKERNQLAFLGEFDSLIKIGSEYRKKYPFERLQFECHSNPRNYTWVSRITEIQSRFGSKVKYFLFSGYNHFIPESANKDESILKLLRDEGYSIERIKAAQFDLLFR